MCDKTLEQLYADLDASEILFAQKYLEFRDRVVRTDKDGRPIAWLSIDDARANALLFLRKMAEPALELPEVIRFRIHEALRIERAVES